MNLPLIDPDTTRQIEVFEFAAKPLIDGIFEGINCTLFCYGQKNQINENKTQNLIKKYENFKVENDLKVSIEYREIDKYILDVLFKTSKDQNLILHWRLCKNKNWFHPRKEWLPPNSKET